MEWNACIFKKTFKTCPQEENKTDTFWDPGFRRPLYWSPRNRSKSLVEFIAAGHQPAADHILERFEIFGWMVRWFNQSVTAALCSYGLSECLATAPVFLLGATRHFVLFSCKICAEIVVHRMFTVSLNGLNGKRSSRGTEHFFSVYLFYSRFQD